MKIKFNYDSTNDLLLVTNTSLTPCGNSFSIAFKGGKLNNTLQLWKSTPQIISETPPPSCLYFEETLYSIFDISCNKQNYGDIIVHTDSDANSFVLERKNRVFSTDFITFEEDILSFKKNVLEHIKLITSDNSYYIEFTNVDKLDLYIEVFSILGERIIKKTPYQKKIFSLNTLQSGLYIIKLSNSNSEFKTFKYLN